MSRIVTTGNFYSTFFTLFSIMVHVLVLEIIFTNITNTETIIILKALRLIAVFNIGVLVVNIFSTVSTEPLHIH